MEADAADINADRHIDGLRNPARRHAASNHRRFQPRPEHDQPAGRKGVGEGGTVVSTPTVMNAILYALAPLGVTNVPMPAIPECIWRAMRDDARA